ncbi:MAG TPA: ABC-F type ribosomal protection protein [Pseudobacteroides sp.]|uniref:ribosomal protection-like ABC-F family protein n=1 Tax=Pseudobacteroides sp. TaxID=1968840 RepID=UPI002F947DA2
MLILEAGNIKKYYKDRLIVGFDNLKVYKGDKIGIVGQNGSGKTTLLNILSKIIDPDEGFVKQYSDISYIKQFSDEKMEADPKALKEFKLHNLPQHDRLSGGERTRIKIANAISKDNLILFADEPTANLDYKGVGLLKEKLLEAESLLLISHDRDLLDSVCNKILEVKDGEIAVFSGNYSCYKEQLDTDFRHKEQEYEKYVSQKAKLTEAINDRYSKSKAMKKTPKRMGNSEARLHKRETTQIQKKLYNAANSMKTRLDKLEVKEKPNELPTIKLDFSLTNPPENRIVISAKDLSCSFGDKKLFDGVKFDIYNGSKTALWGENGTGKTTLLNLIYEKADKNLYIVPKARIGYFCQGFENLDNSKTVLENVMDGSVQSQAAARTVLARLLIGGEDVFKKVGVLSGGERVKVSFAKLFVSDANVLLLDEPTNFLDMLSIEALENVLCDYEGTVIFVSHDREFVSKVANRVIAFGSRTVREIEDNLEDFIYGRQKAVPKETNKMDRIVIELKITEILSKLSMPGADRAALEAEYQRLIKL